MWAVLLDVEWFGFRGRLFDMISTRLLIIAPRLGEVIRFEHAPYICVAPNPLYPRTQENDIVKKVGDFVRAKTDVILHWRSLRVFKFKAPRTRELPETTYVVCPMWQICTSISRIGFSFPKPKFYARSVNMAIIRRAILDGGCSFLRPFSI